MALWGKSTSAESRPKFLGGDGAIQKKEECFATTRGWEIKAGTKASGNDNANAQPELLVAIGGLSTVLGAANLLSVDWTDGTYAHDGSADFDIVFTYDEAVTVTSEAATADNTISNKVFTSMQILGPTDMASDADMKMLGLQAVISLLQTQQRLWQQTVLQQWLTVTVQLFLQLTQTTVVVQRLQVQTVLVQFGVQQLQEQALQQIHLLLHLVQVVVAQTLY